MDTPSLTHSHESRGRNTKAHRYAFPYADNYIDAEPSLGYREHTDRRGNRFVKKRRAESHEHYVCIVQDDNGTWSVRSSESLRAVKKLVLANSMPHINAVFGNLEHQLDDLEPEPMSHVQVEPIQACHHNPRTSTISYPFATKRRRAVSESTSGGVQCVPPPPSVGPLVSAEIGQPKTTTGRKKARRDRVMLQIRVDERDKWMEWMQNAFKAIQQTACRSIAKEWIKAIHPKKQSTHPYNGNMPRNSHKSPDRTRPPYWPKHIRHKEPDHIDKAARTDLLTWLLMHTPQAEIVPDKDKKTDKCFTARDLLAVLEQKQDEFVMPRMELIRDVIQVRTCLEAYEDGGTDADALIDVVDWSESFRNGSGGKRRKDDLGSTIKTEDEAEMESNEQDDEDACGATVAADMSEDENGEVRSQENSLDADDTTTANSFISEAPPEDDNSHSEHAAPHQHPDPFHHMTAGQHGFGVSSGKAEQDSMRMNQRNHSMQFSPHHGVTNDHHFAPQTWGIAPTASSGMTGSFGEGMMMVPNPVGMVDQHQYEEGVALRPRVMNGMVSADLYHEDQSYAYQMDHDMQRSYHMAQMGGNPHGGMLHGYNGEMFPTSTSYGASFMS